ncbi:MAG: cell division protein SepF [Ruminococcaceae bacterium]|nr:cell division protein SepF [Oscillospiraceae bacterium]
MFGKLADKLNKKFQNSEEEITFKSFEEADEAEAQKTEAIGSTLKADESEKDSSIKFKLVKPQGFDEVSKIADHLIEGCTVVLNTELLDMATCRRMLDFLNGVTYTTEGYINPVAANTFIITPHDVDVSDDTED